LGRALADSDFDRGPGPDHNPSQPEQKLLQVALRQTRVVMNQNLEACSITRGEFHSASQTDNNGHNPSAALNTQPD